MLDQQAAIRLASLLTLDDEAFLVGGQAVSVLAEYFYPRAKELYEYAPYTTKDVDYFGRIEAAQKFAQATNGYLKRPSIYDATPSTALVECTFEGHWVQVDFLDFVLGTDPARLVDNAIEIELPIAGSDGLVLKLPVMNPLHCYQSRIANAVKLGRTGEIAVRQMYAAHYVLRAYIDEMADADVRSAKKILQAFFKYLTGTPEGRQAHKCSPLDPGSIIAHFDADERFDPQYRLFNIGAMKVRLALPRLGASAAISK